MQTTAAGGKCPSVNLPQEISSQVRLQPSPPSLGLLPWSLSTATNLGNFLPGLLAFRLCWLLPFVSSGTVTFITPWSFAQTVIMTPTSYTVSANSFRWSLRPFVIWPWLTWKPHFLGFLYHSPNSLTSCIHSGNILKVPQIKHQMGEQDAASVSRELRFWRWVKHVKKSYWIVCCYIYSLNISWIFNKYLWYAKNAQGTRLSECLTFSGISKSFKEEEALTYSWEMSGRPPGGGLPGRDKVHVQKQWPGGQLVMVLPEWCLWLELSFNIIQGSSLKKTPSPMSPNSQHTTSVSV